MPRRRQDPVPGPLQAGELVWGCCCLRARGQASPLAGVRAKLRAAQLKQEISGIRAVRHCAVIPSSFCCGCLCPGPWLPVPLASPAVPAWGHGGGCEAPAPAAAPVTALWATGCSDQLPFPRAGPVPRTGASPTIAVTHGGRRPRLCLPSAGWGVPKVGGALKMHLRGWKSLAG